MSTRGFFRIFVSAIFLLLLAPVIGDFFVELARENGLYDRPTDRVWRVVAAAQSVFGAKGFYWLLFFTGGLAIGLWLDLFLKRREVPKSDPLERVRQRIAAVARGRSYDLRHDNIGPHHGTDWPAELRSLYLLMIKAGFRTPKMGIGDTLRESLEFHVAFLTEIEPLVRDGQSSKRKPSPLSWLLASKASYILMNWCPSIKCLRYSSVY